MSSSSSTTHPTANARRAALSGFLGSTLEYYDFFIYASAAALYFPRVFFPGHGSNGTVISIATLGVAYIARPLGAILWGHLGDKIGRKESLFACLMLMGGSTFLIGCLPTYGTVGALAPILLIVLRLLQGLSAGGESPGSSSLTLEHAPERRRAFFTSFTLSGVQFGIVVSSLVFIPFASMPDSALYSWGWRVPFWLSILVTAIALWIRKSLDEPEVFEEAKENHETAGVPILELLRWDWLTVVRVALAASFPVINNMVTVFALSYATHHGFTKTSILYAIAAANFTAVLTQPLYALLSDRVGRKPVFAIGGVGAGLMMFVFLYEMSVHNVTLTYVSVIVLIGVLYAMPNSVYPSYFPEQFPANVRYTGMAVGLMLGLLLSGFTPAIADAMVGENGSWVPVAWLSLGVALVASVAALSGPETYRTPTHELGLHGARHEEARQAHLHAA
ncbi:MFS transporter [Tsukamurella soli]|uniref:MFS transporter n=1 Tax=Tsukamurella soli TaxID=644556 RepID=A0ABP8KGZ0_9ACTN